MPDLFKDVLFNTGQFDIPYFRPESKGQTTAWLWPDTLEAYQANQTNGSVHGLTPTSVSYVHNKYGFRTGEFNTDPCLLSLGCSITKGIGVPIDATFTTKVAESLSLQPFNLGVGGNNNDFIFLQFTHAIEKLDAKVVLMNWTYPSRTYFTNGKRINFIGAHFNARATLENSYPDSREDVDYVAYNKRIDVWFTHVARMLTYIKAVDTICRLKSVRVVHNVIGVDPRDNFTTRFIRDRLHTKNPVLFNDVNDNRARDCSHPGVEWHNTMAQRIQQALLGQK